MNMTQDVSGASGHPALFTPLRLGEMELPNRIVMAPLTRLRASTDGMPTSLMTTYYRQRASMGLIVTEGTWPVLEGRTWIGQPSISTTKQVDGWKRIADAVHDAGGRIAMQIMHGGRVSHPSLTLSGRVVAPSAIAGPYPIRTPGGKAQAPIPHTLLENEIRQLVEQFVAASRRAIDAGMDAVELHGANGYLIHQFFSPAANRRHDTYGGSAENRARFAIEVTRAVAREIGGSRTAIRLSPANPIQAMDEFNQADVQETYCSYARAVAPLGLAFLDILHEDPKGSLVQAIRQYAGSPLIVNTGFQHLTTRESAIAQMASGAGDAIGVGRAAIANPDLVDRWKAEYPLNVPDQMTFYTPGAHGYTDYPMMA
ncbi:alkene reductase [uncultured Corynebacterium sp.]|uniref:alkene reductase n=1 Tax=uncultured Corynebacterium sp. TaxID=159447 RepID=UPI0025EE88ED|nr:alkene reductase [uncultured Corynebacterium sp.]